ncbi:Hpt domain-containing protein [Sphingomonas quercus]|uniref:Hpt domain-containing protein n=1 Tax=Sphingomonas quercus TaxID=2842451 RepID=A0ABS6BIZ0_9SPHN|nr:Hpt domain-containing protein [Sphingomonas quercus]MBU3078271.1 Hpt domain-containing protein [Sphingomonas quercus]
MKHDALSLEEALAAAGGDDADLRAELRAAFLESLGRHGLALASAATVTEWRNAAWRLKGCAASFGATDLMAAADSAACSRVGDADALAAVGRATEALAA